MQVIGKGGTLLAQGVDDNHVAFLSAISASSLSLLYFQLFYHSEYHPDYSCRKAAV